MLLLLVSDTARNVTFEPLDDEYYPGDSIECQAKGNPRPSIQWEQLEGSGGDANIDDTHLLITSDMMGDNVWACNVENTVQENTTSGSEEISFEVCKFMIVLLFSSLLEHVT